MWTKDQIVENMKISQKVMQRAIIAIYSKQTADEQRTEETRHNNGIGFNGSDAIILSSFAKQIQRGATLSAKQMAIALKKMPKYAGQLERIAKGEI